MGEEERTDFRAWFGPSWAEPEMEDLESYRRWKVLSQSCPTARRVLLLVGDLPQQLRFLGESMGLFDGSLGVLHSALRDFARTASIHSYFMARSVQHVIDLSRIFLKRCLVARRWCEALNRYDFFHCSDAEEQYLMLEMFKPSFDGHDAMALMAHQALSALFEATDYQAMVLERLRQEGKPVRVRTAYRMSQKVDLDAFDTALLVFEERVMPCLSEAQRFVDSAEKKSMTGAPHSKMAALELRTMVSSFVEQSKIAALAEIAGRVRNRMEDVFSY